MVGDSWIAVDGWGQSRFPPQLQEAIARLKQADYPKGTPEFVDDAIAVFQYFLRLISEWKSLNTLLQGLFEAVDPFEMSVAQYRLDGQSAVPFSLLSQHLFKIRERVDQICKSVECQTTYVGHFPADDRRKSIFDEGKAGNLREKTQAVEKSIQRIGEDVANPEENVYHRYQVALDELIERIKAISRDYHQKALVLQARMEDNIWRSRAHGDTELTRAERMDIVDSLNALALKSLGTSFNDLCPKSAGLAGISYNSLYASAIELRTIVLEIKNQVGDEIRQAADDMQRFSENILGRMRP